MARFPLRFWFVERTRIRTQNISKDAWMLSKTQGYDTVVAWNIDFADVQLEKNGDDC